MRKKDFIFIDDLSDYLEAYADEIKADLIADADDDHEPSDDEIEAEAESRINADADDFRDLLEQYDKKAQFNKIVVVASLGLWYGRREARAEFNTLSEAVNKCVYDYNYFYFTAKNSTLNAEAVHHDGRNYYKFYKDVNGRLKAIKRAELVAGAL